MQRPLLIASLLAASLAIGCGETKPGGDSAAPKFESESAPAETSTSEAAAETTPADAASDEKPAGDNEAAEPEMKDEEAPAEEKPAAAEETSADEKPAEKPAAEEKAPSDESAAEAEKPAETSTAKRSSGGLFKGLVNSVTRGAKKTIKGAKPAAETPTAEPKAEDDPFPKGEPSDKPAEEKPDANQ